MHTSSCTRLVKMKEVVLRLGMCRATVYNMIHRGEFPPPKKRGRSSFWREEDVSAKIAEIIGDDAPVRIQ